MIICLNWTQRWVQTDEKFPLSPMDSTFDLILITEICFLIIPDMRKDVQEIFRSTPHGKQVMMFSATLSKEIRPICKKFMQDVNTRVPNYDYHVNVT